MESGGVPERKLFWAVLTLVWGFFGPGCSGDEGGLADQGSVHEAREGSLAAILTPGARPRKLAGGLRLAEGPAWRPAVPAEGPKGVPTEGAEEEGRLLLSDVVGDRLLAWTAAGGLQTVAAGLGAPNGNAVGANGEVWTCLQGARSVVRWELPGPGALGGGPPVSVQRIERSARVQAAEAGSASPPATPRLHSPNDLVIDAEGGLWVTDPPYGLWYGDGVAERATNDVMYVASGADLARSVLQDLALPNGIALAPGGDTLYVGDAQDGCLWAYAVSAPGRVAKGRRLVAQFEGLALDGLFCDELGNVYACVEQGVQILDAQGVPLGRIELGDTTRDGAFGGADGRTLFLTAGGSLYAIPTLVGAARP